MEGDKGNGGSCSRRGASVKRKTHILIVSQYFYPETFRINDMAAEWVKRGYKVTVLTGIPNYPAGKFFEGYGYTKNRFEKWNGVNIIRIPLVPRGKGPAGMVANYLSFVVSGFLWSLFTDVNADIVFTFEVSPMTQALAGVWYAKRHHAKHYLYVQDLWPENVETVAGIHHPAVIGAIHRMADYIYKNSDEIFAASPSFARAVCRRKVDRRKVHYWPQYAEDFYKPYRLEGRQPFKLIFTGNIGYAQGLELLPKAAERMKGENVQFVVVGDGRYRAAFEKDIARRGVRGKFVLYPRQDARQIPKLLAACDAAFLSFMDTRLFEMTIPAKLQSYMACGMPVLAAASGETKRIIERAGCGICTPPGDARGLVLGIRKMMEADRDTMGRKSREYYEKHFERKILLDWFEQYLEGI